MPRGLETAEVKSIAVVRKIGQISDTLASIVKDVEVKSASYNVDGEVGGFEEQKAKTHVSSIADLI